MQKLRTLLARIFKLFKRYQKPVVFAFLVLVVVAMPVIVFAESDTDASSSTTTEATTPPTTSAGNTDIVGGTDTITVYIATAGTVVLNFIASALGKMITITISLVIIPILGYNNFGSSHIVSIGWPLVRDVVNMFVIIILLFIAIKTMLGLSGGKSWEQQIPGLFLAVVAVNFSKTIATLGIDFGQVIMMTFVNALRDIAAGNFVNLFQLDSFLSISPETTEAAIGAAAANPSLTAGGYLASAYLLVMLLGVVLATMLILAAVFIYRIVILWVLIIMAPLAFFMAGIKDIIPSAGGKWDEWKKTFVGAVTLGPIMTFFLWLALAAASSGSLAASEGFEASEDNSTYGLINEIFQVDKLLSLFIGLMIILVGFKASSSAASSMGGFAGSLINEGMGKKLLAGAARAPYALPIGAARVTARVAGRVGAAGVGMAAGAYGMATSPAAMKTAGLVAGEFESRTGFGASIGKSLSQQGARAGGLPGAALAYAGSAVSRRALVRKQADAKTAKTNLDGRTADERAGLTGALQGKGEHTEEGRRYLSTAAGRAEIQQHEFKIATDKKYADQARTDFKALNNTETDPTKKAARDKDLDDNFDTIKAQSVTNTMARADKHDFASDDKARDKIDKMKLENMSIIVNAPAGKEKDGTSIPPTPAQKQKRAQDLVNIPKMDYSKLTADDLGDEFIREELAKLKSKPKIINGQEVPVSALERIQSGELGVKPETRDAANKPLDVKLESSGAYNISASIAGGQTELSSVKASDFSTKPAKPGDPSPNGQNVTRGVIESGVDLSGMDVDVSDAFVETAKKLYSESSDNPVLQGKIEVSIANATGDLTTIGVNNNGSIAPESRAKVQQIIKNEPKIIMNMKGHIARGVASGGNDATRVASQAFTKNDFDKLAEENIHATDVRKAEVAEMARLVSEAIAVELTTPEDKRLTSDTELINLQKGADRLNRLMTP